jgi:hypothetical protein
MLGSDLLQKCPESDLKFGSVYGQACFRFASFVLLCHLNASAILGTNRRMGDDAAQDCLYTKEGGLSKECGVFSDMSRQPPVR